MNHNVLLGRTIANIFFAALSVLPLARWPKPIRTARWNRRPRPARWRDGHHRESVGRAAWSRPEANRDHRQPGGGELGHRVAGGRARGARRIHAAAHGELPHDASVDGEKSAVRRFEGLQGCRTAWHSPLIFVSSAGSGVRSVADFKAYAARSRDGVTFATSSMETRLGAELVLQQVGAKGVIVNYKGTGPAMGDIAGGHVPLFVTTFSSALPFKDTGKINLVGVAAQKRNADLPGVPTVEQDLDVEVGSGTPSSRRLERPTK